MGKTYSKSKKSSYKAPMKKSGSKVWNKSMEKGNTPTNAKARKEDMGEC